MMQAPPIKVLMVFSTSQLGGAERSLSRMALASAHSNIRYQLASLEGDGPWCQWVASQGHTPMRFGGQGFFGRIGMLGAVVRLIRYVRAERMDVVYVCGTRASFWLRLLYVWIKPAKLVHGVRSNFDRTRLLDKFQYGMERWLSRPVAAWIANSKNAYDTLVSWNIPSARVHVVYNGIANITNMEAASFSARPLDIVTIANLLPIKGHIPFLRVIAHTAQKLPGAAFHFVGRDGMQGAVQQAIIEKGLGHVAYCQGFQKNVAPWLARARVLVLPSLAEGSPTVILEAFNQGVPVIAYAVGGIPELIENGVDGFLIAPGDEAAMANRMIELLENPDMGEMMGKRGQEKVRARLSVEACVANHQRIFERIVRSS